MLQHKIKGDFFYFQIILISNSRYFNSQATNIAIGKTDMSQKINQLLNKQDEEIIAEETVVKNYKLSDIINRFVSYVENSPIYKKSTAKRYRNLRNNIFKFIKKYHDPDANGIDSKFVLNFAIFLSNRAEI